MQVVPIFPLGVVLFPGTRIPLHIFEPRYQALVRDCLANDSHFGVVALRRGSDTDTDPAWYELGTLARIERVVRLPRGKLNLVVAGATRFQAVRRVEGRPYLRAEVELVESRRSGASGLFAATQLRHPFERYRQSLLSMGVIVPSFAELPKEPAELSWAVANHLVVELRAKQRLLEESDPMERLRLELSLLRRESVLLERNLANRLVETPFYSLN
ncbi:MAG: LON peptidase substrate-binding domain-containing protein [Candidatus Dormibacteraeota bacterium]|nr:LON peptidase substrate-binding domain-containing protein [Candidatus Dormibacteraeota bacterium]